jgi:hypothetical protein
MKAAKTDKNQAEIVKALRKVGASVQLLHRVGGGCPDLLVWYNGYYLFEVKTKGSKLNKLQQKWWENWHGELYTVTSAEDAIKLITSYTDYRRLV